MRKLKIVDLPKQRKVIHVKLYPEVERIFAREPLRLQNNRKILIDKHNNTDHNSRHFSYTSFNQWLKTTCSFQPGGAYFESLVSTSRKKCSSSLKNRTRLDGNIKVVCTALHHER